MPPPSDPRRRGGRGAGKPAGRPARPGPKHAASGGGAGRGQGRAGDRPPRRDQDGRRGGADRSGRADRAERGRASVPKPTGRAGAWGGLARRAAGSGGTAAPAGPGKGRRDRDGDDRTPAKGRGRLADAPPSRAAESFRKAAGGDDEGAAPVRRAAKGAVDRGFQSGGGRTRYERTDAAPPRRPSRPSGPNRTGAPRRAPAKGLAEELGPIVGKATAPGLAQKLADGSRAFEAERFADARRMLAPLADRAPASAAVRELYGLTLYRLGRWGEAIRELEAFRQLSGSTDQHPVLADSYRALGRYEAVEALWHELREASPSAELVAEGRIVYAGSLADRDLVREAIAVIEPAVRKVRAPKEHHLRLLYVLADLYERAGDQPRARSLFDRLVTVAPGFADAAERRRAL